MAFLENVQHGKKLLVICIMRIFVLCQINTLDSPSLVSEGWAVDPGLSSTAWLAYFGDQTLPACTLSVEILNECFKNEPK